MFARSALAFPEWLFGSFPKDDGRLSRGELPASPNFTPREPSPDALWVRLKAGDQTALREAHTAYAAELWRHAYRYLHDRDAAEDAVQDVFVALWERREVLSSKLAVRAYLFTAVRNRALKQLRHHAVVAKVTQAGQDTENFASSERHADEASLLALVRRAINELPERQRTAIELRWLRGLNHTEIAAVLGISEAAVRKLVTKALIRLETLHQRLHES